MVMLIMKSLFLLIHVLCDTIQLKAITQKKTLYLAYHKELTYIKAHFSVNNNYFYNLSLNPIIIEEGDEQLLEGGDLISPFIFKITYETETGCNFSLILLDQQDNIAFKIFLNNPDVGKTQLEEQIIFSKDIMDEAGNIAQSIILNASLFNVFIDKNQFYDVWAVGDNDLLQVKLEMYVEVIEFSNLFRFFISKLNSAYMLIIENINSITNIESKDFLDELKYEVIRKISSCYSGIFYFIGRMYGIFNSTTFGEVFLTDEDICVEEKLFLDEKTKFLTSSSKLLENVVDELKITIEKISSTSQEHDAELISIVEELKSQIVKFFNAFRMRDRVKEKKLISKITKKDKILIKNIHLIEHSTKIFNLGMMFVSALKVFDLLEMDFDFYSFCRKKMFKENCIPTYTCYKIFYDYRCNLGLERYINDPSKRNLQHLLSNERISKLKINKMIEDLNKTKKFIESELDVEFLDKIKLITNTRVGYKEFLLRVEVVLKSLEEFRILNPIISAISFEQIINEMLLKDLI